MRGLYVHVPFCVRKCAYCDFYSLAGHTELIEPYVDAVLKESRQYAGLSFQTLYFGGGTPSLLGAEGLDRFLDGLRRSFDLSGLVEATIEVNPDSANIELFEIALRKGINRVSIGVQSLADDELRSVGRIHTAIQAMNAIELAKATGFSNISADVIVGLPCQTWQTLRHTLITLLGAGIQHLSLYCLSLEPDTPLALAPPEDLPSDDTQAELFESARGGFLEKHGFVHYEISNFALPGYECQHNLNYWRGGEYLGLGPAAASHLNGKRFRNCPDLKAYLGNPTALVADIEALDVPEKAAEEAMLRLRLLAEGLNIDELIRRYGQQGVTELTDRLHRLAEMGLLDCDGRSYRLPPSRILTSNPVLSQVLAD